jgi:hypothetical protein
MKLEDIMINKIIQTQKYCVNYMQNLKKKNQTQRNENKMVPEAGVSELRDWGDVDQMTQNSRRNNFKRSIVYHSDYS